MKKSLDSEDLRFFPIKKIHRKNPKAFFFVKKTVSEDSSIKKFFRGIFFFKSADSKGFFL